MSESGLFIKALGLGRNVVSDLKHLSKITGISHSKLCYYNKYNILPSGSDLDLICHTMKVSPLELQLSMGIMDGSLNSIFQRNASRIAHLLEQDLETNSKTRPMPKLSFQTHNGKLYQGDCIDLLHNMKDESVDLIFADPPFNLNKLYPSQIDDNLKTNEYLLWSEQWITECIRVLKFGGSFFLWNIPKWNTYFSSFLNSRLTFRHWISVDIKYSLPIAQRLYPSHYSLLYYCKGEKPKTFHPDRIPMKVCPSCKQDLADYGGYKDKMNPKGVNQADVWYDIPPVRHNKYKGRKNGNELSIKLLDRIIEMSSEEADIVFDPFGGSGTTYIVSEIKKRNWIGIEVGPLEDIIERFKRLENEKDYLAKIRKDLNCLFTEDTLTVRTKKGLWTCETIKHKKSNPVIENIQFQLFA